MNNGQPVPSPGADDPHARAGLLLCTAPLVARDSFRGPRPALVQKSARYRGRSLVPGKTEFLHKLYVTLAVFGAVVSFALADKSHQPGLLVLPMVSLVLGWTYIVNDEKISAIGRYIRHDLSDRLHGLVGDNDAKHPFGREVAHREDKHRKSRKRRQFVVDELTFVGTGAVGLCTYMVLEQSLPCLTWVAVGLDVVMLVVIAVDIFRYADFAKGR